MVKLPTEITNIINDFKVGHKTYWVHQYKAVVNEIKQIRFYVFTEWSNDNCNICRYNINELTTELTYDEAMNQVNIHLYHTINSTCGCRIINSEIHLVNDNYYNSINHMSDEEYEYHYFNDLFYESSYDYMI